MSQRLWVLCGWVGVIMLAVVLMDFKSAVDLRAADVQRLQTNVARLQRVAEQPGLTEKANAAVDAENVWLQNLLQAKSMPLLKVQLMESFSGMLAEARVAGFDVALSDSPYTDPRYKVVAVKLTGSFTPASMYALLAAVDDTASLRQFESLVIKDRRMELVLRLLCRVDNAGVTQ